MGDPGRVTARRDEGASHSLSGGPATRLKALAASYSDGHNDRAIAQADPWSRDNDSRGNLNWRAAAASDPRVRQRPSQLGGRSLSAAHRRLASRQELGDVRRSVWLPKRPIADRRLLRGLPQVSRAGGFTPTELLPFIASIAILAAILLPASAQAREKAR